MLRVAQEAIANAVRHGRPSALRVVLSCDETCAILRVRDDGAGFEPEAVDARRGLGLRSMRERLRALAGTLEVRSGLGEGTVVEASLPR